MHFRLHAQTRRNYSKSSLRKRDPKMRSSNAEIVAAGWQRPSSDHGARRNINRSSMPNFKPRWTERPNRSIQTSQKYQTRMPERSVATVAARHEGKRKEASFIQIIVHKTYQPNIVVNFFDADRLAAKTVLKFIFFAMVCPCRGEG